jgi:hypothetical protein
MAVRGLSYIFMTMLVAILAGCAGGAMVVKAPVAPTQAIVKVRTSGTLPAGATIGGIQTTITYPTTKGLSTTENGVVASGSGVGAGSILMPNVNNPGQVMLILANVAPGIQSGEFATLTFSIATANSPVAGDFAIASDARILDTDSKAITGMTVDIQGVTFQ